MGIRITKINDSLALNVQPAPAAENNLPAVADVLNQVATRLATNPNRLFGDRQQTTPTRNNVQVSIAPPNSPR